MEEGVLQFWEERNIFKKSIEYRPEEKEYVFYDGPPFATGLPHFGHIVPGTIKDTIPRYQTMKGRRVNRRFGWDCHGLPVEYEIEKSEGISGYSAIVEFGVARFNEMCRSIVLRYTKEWETTIKRTGRWVDWEDSYRTMDLSYMESIWWVFKTLYEKGYIYEGYNILPYSPKLASPLSNFEVNLGGYQDVRIRSPFVSKWTARRTPISRLDDDTMDIAFQPRSRIRATDRVCEGSTSGTATITSSEKTGCPTTPMKSCTRS